MNEIIFANLTGMAKRIAIFCLGFLLMMRAAAQQKPLPAITVKNIGNKIIISWVNDYPRTVTVLNIQRSYDSLKNYSTIGSVLSPQSRENGYTDDNPPYKKMFYRVFLSFEGGDYAFSLPARPVKDVVNEQAAAERYSWMAPPAAVSAQADTAVHATPPAVNGQPEKPVITYPSLRVFTAKDNNVVINLPEAAQKKYSVKFFDDNDKFLFELTKVKEEFLIVEKVNFVHSGWFRFEVYENGVMIEANKFQIAKDMKKL